MRARTRALVGTPLRRLWRRKRRYASSSSRTDTDLLRNGPIAAHQLTRARRSSSARGAAYVLEFIGAHKSGVHGALEWCNASSEADMAPLIVADRLLLDIFATCACYRLQRRPHNLSPRRIFL